MSENETSWLEPPPSRVGELFFRAVDHFDDRPSMRHREANDWVDISWREFGKRAEQLGAAMLALGVQQGDRVCILSNTRWEWAVADQAILAIGAVTVPIYQSNLPDEVHYILDHAGAKVVFCEDIEQLSKVRQVREDLPDLKHAVLISGKIKDDAPPFPNPYREQPEGDKHKEEKMETFVLPITRLFSHGKEVLTSAPTLVRDRACQGDTDEMASIVYTSGTTGRPKGAVLSHDCILFEMECLSSNLHVDASDETLLFLPMAHIFARVGFLATLRMGYVVSFAQSIEALLDNLAEVKPTFMFSVPRIYEKVYNKVISGVAAGSRLKKQLFGFAMLTGRAVADRREARKFIPPWLAWPNQVAEMLVFNKLKNTFGGNLRFFISGGAPLSKEIAQFFLSAGILVLEGYGLTENTAASNLNTPDAFRLGTVGKALPGVGVRIAEDGEIMLKGRNVFKGYYRREDATAEAMEPDGWFHTGDIGVIDADGFLKITDRKKDLIVTSGGKNVAPQNIENHIKTHPMVSQVMVYGDRRKYLTALLTLDPDEAASYAERHELEYEEFEDLCAHPEVKEKMERVIQEKNRHLASYETIKKFVIVAKDFEIGDELTPTLKVKRKVVTEKYWGELGSMYDEEVL